MYNFQEKAKQGICHWLIWCGSLSGSDFWHGVDVLLRSTVVLCTWITVFELVGRKGCPKGGAGRIPVTKSLISRCISVLSYLDLGNGIGVFVVVLSALHPYSFNIYSGDKRNRGIYQETQKKRGFTIYQSLCEYMYIIWLFIYLHIYLHI